MDNLTSKFTFPCEDYQFLVDRYQALCRFFTKELKKF